MRMQFRLLILAISIVTLGFTDRETQSKLSECKIHIQMEGSVSPVKERKATNDVAELCSPRTEGPTITMIFDDIPGDQRYERGPSVTKIWLRPHQVKSKLKYIQKDLLPNYDDLIDSRADVDENIVSLGAPVSLKPSSIYEYMEVFDALTEGYDKLNPESQSVFQESMQNYRVVLTTGYGIHMNGRVIFLPLDKGSKLISWVEAEIIGETLERKPGFLKNLYLKVF